MRLITRPPKCKGWWKIECSECGTKTEDRYVEIGEELSSDSMTVYLCFGCILSALETIQPQVDEDEE